MSNILKKSNKNEKKIEAGREVDELYIKNFVDMTCPSIFKFNSDHYIIGNTYRKVIAIRNYAITTQSTAILARIAEKSNITLKIYFGQMGKFEYDKSVESTVNKNSNEANEKQFAKSVEAQQNMGVTRQLIEFLHSNPDERMFKVTVFIEVIGNTKKEMEELFSDVTFLFEGITYDNLYLHQKEGFISVNPVGSNQFGIQFERHMPSSSAANLFPLSYSEKIDKEGFPLGKDKSGGKLIIDFDKRDQTHTNSNILILGNSGEGKTYLLNLISTNCRLKGKNLIGLDAEGTGIDITRNLGGTYLDVLSGNRIINFLEPKMLSSNDDDIEFNENDADFVAAFSQKTVLNQHISSLRDFFRIYKNMDETLLDVIEIMLGKTYKKFNITFESDLSSLTSKDYPIAIDLYKTVEDDFINYDKLKNPIYTKPMLQTLLLHLNSLCKGADSRFFNGHTNIESYDYLTFGVKSLLETSENLKNAMFFNILCYMNNKLLIEGNTYANIDELYLFLENLTMIKYIRNFTKRVRKKDSAIVLASQNIEDFLRKDIAELTKPLFAIPTYKFLFHPGDIDENLYKKLLNVNDSEYNLIKSPRRGNCFFKSGNERYNLQVEAPTWKSALWGTAGGR